MNRIEISPFGWESGLRTVRPDGKPRSDYTTDETSQNRQVERTFVSRRYPGRPSSSNRDGPRVHPVNPRRPGNCATAMGGRAKAADAAAVFRNILRGQPDDTESGL